MNRDSAPPSPHPRFETSLWPPVEELVSGGRSGPGLLASLEGATTVWNVVEGLTLDAAEAIGAAMARNADLQWQMIIGIMPASCTTSASLRRIDEVRQSSHGRLGVGLLLPRQLRAEELHQNVGLVWYADGRRAIWIGSCPSLGEGVAFEPFLMMLEPARDASYAAVFSYLRAMHSLATPLSEASLNLPVLTPARGTEEAERLWQEYQDALLVCDGSIAVRRIDDLAVDKDGGLHVRHADNIQTPVRPPKCVGPQPDRLTVLASGLFERTSHVIVGRPTRPATVTVKHEWIGLRPAAAGRVKAKVQVTVDLFDEADMKEIEALRKRTARFIEILGISVSDSVRVLASRALRLLKEGITAAESEAAQRLGKLFNVDATAGSEAIRTAVRQFVAQRQAAIRDELERKVREIGIAGKLPDDCIENVIEELVSRGSMLVEGNLLAPFAAQPFPVALVSRDSNGQEWQMALRLIDGALRRPRELLRDDYGPRQLHGTGMGIAAFLAATRLVDGDTFYSDPALARCEYVPGQKPQIPREVSDRARKDLEEIAKISEGDEAARERVEKLLEWVQLARST